jgi:hypothetical protein
MNKKIPPGKFATFKNIESAEPLLFLLWKQICLMWDCYFSHLIQKGKNRFEFLKRYSYTQYSNIELFTFGSGVLISYGKFYKK